MSEERVEKLMCSQMRKFDSLPKETQDLKQCKHGLYRKNSLGLNLYCFDLLISLFCHLLYGTLTFISKLLGTGTCTTKIVFVSKDCNEFTQ